MTTPAGNPPGALKSTMVTSAPTGTAREPPGATSTRRPSTSSTKAEICPGWAREPLTEGASSPAGRRGGVPEGRGPASAKTAGSPALAERQGTGGLSRGGPASDRNSSRMRPMTVWSFLTVMKAGRVSFRGRPKSFQVPRSSTAADKPRS